MGFRVGHNTTRLSIFSRFFLRPVKPAILLVALTQGALLQDCCSPNSCRQAKSGIMVLDGAIQKIEQYKERNGRYPVILDHIEKGFTERLEKVLRTNCPDCTDFHYGTDSFGFEMEYRYYQMGKNVCRYDTESEKWNCKGVY